MISAVIIGFSPFFMCFKFFYYIFIDTLIKSLALLFIGSTFLYLFSKNLLKFVLKIQYFECNSSISIKDMYLTIRI